MKIIVINLERAEERKERMLLQFQKLGISDYIFYPAIDGKDITNKNFFGNIAPGHFGHPRKFQKGEIGCIISHIGAITFAKLNNWDYFLLLEDDVILCDDFNDRLNLLFKLLPSSWDLVYLSGHTYYTPAPFILPSLLPVNFKVSGAYSCIIKNIAYDKIIKKFSSFETTTDDLYEEMILREKSLKSFIFFPFFCYPIVEDSYIWETSGNKIPHASVRYFKNKLNE